MLYSIDSNEYIIKLPHKKEFDLWMKNLSATDYQNIVDELNTKIDDRDIHTAGWIPGNDWTNTVYHPIYLACRKNEESSGMFFGLLLFNLLMNHEDKVWGFGRFEKDGVSIRSMTYFVLKNPPPLT